MNKEIFTKLAPHNDDIWFWAMAVLNDTKIKIPENAISDLIHIGIETKSLWEINSTGKGNVEFRQVLEKYPEVYNKIVRETAILKPYISIIILLKDKNKISKCWDNLISNGFLDIELIIVNVGTQINSEGLAYNCKLINFPGASIGEAWNVGLSKASGDFVIFKDDAATFLLGALASIAQIASVFNPEVIHCSAHCELKDDGKPEYIADDEMADIEEDSFNFAVPNKQIRAVRWFKNKFSHKLDTKIFKREFLLKNNLKFENDDDSEFMFSCLMAAEKYLVTSQAFLYF